jgi:hypothetical protein
MALTIRSNGNTSQNQITASWFNDFANLLTGVMADQLVTVKNTVRLQAIGAAPGVATLALAAGSNLGVGVYKYAVTFLNASVGESALGTTAQITTTGGNQAVNLTAIPLGPTGTGSRRIYRTAVGGSFFKVLTTISDNTSTTFNDTTADGGLSTNLLYGPSFGGSLFLMDSSSVVNLKLFSDGSMWTNIPGISVSGSTSGTASVQALVSGNFNIIKINENNFNSTAKTIQLLEPITTSLMFWTGEVGASGDGGIQLLNAGSAVSMAIITGLAAAGGSAASQSSAYKYSWALFNGAVDTISFSATSGAHTSTSFLIGQ